MRKLLFIACLLCVFTPVWSVAIAAPTTANFSIHCTDPADVNCELINSNSDSIININDCATLIKKKSTKPGAGKAYLIKHELLGCKELGKKHEPLEGSICKKYFYAEIKYIGANMDFLVTCNDETTYTKTYDSAQTVDVSDYANWSYEKKLCISSGGKYGTSCKCDGYFHIPTPDADNGCICQYLDFQFISSFNGVCADLVPSCTTSGGDWDKKKDKCICDKSQKHLIPMASSNSADNFGCKCDNGYKWIDPIRKELGCVAKNENLTLNLTVQDNSNKPLADVSVTYSDESGKEYKSNTDNSGKITLTNISPTTLIQFIKSGYAPSTHLATELKNTVVLQQKDLGTYHACLGQKLDSSRQGKQIQIDQDSYAYCDDTVENDCKENDLVKSIDNEIYKCTGKQWKRYSDISNCDDGVFRHQYEKIDKEGSTVWAFMQKHLRNKSDGKVYNSIALSDICEIQDINDYCNKHEGASFVYRNKFCNKSQNEQFEQTDGGEVDETETLEEEVEDPQAKPNAPGEAVTPAVNEEPGVAAAVTALTGDNIPNISNVDYDEIIKNAEEAYQDAHDKEQSVANRLVTGVSTAATGLGAMQAASALAKQRVLAESENDMKKYLSTFKCEYGTGQSVDYGATETLMPGDLLDYYKEYEDVADSLKATKTALGLRDGIESEVLYKDSNLYQYTTKERQTTFSDDVFSLARAMTDNDSDDATALAAQKEQNEKQLKVGGYTTLGGLAVGVGGNLLIDHINNKDKENK